ncbi:MAG: 6-phosphofructokinase [Chloroflexi bacterium]|nr:6-phosphofructokinase [Chloroflexota bacterium]
MKKIGILVGGGPAPGINSVIAAAAIEAINSGYKPVGIKNGYQHLVKTDITQTVNLDVESVTKIYKQGGSILNTSRTNPAKSKSDLKNTINSLKKLNIDKLITIGGDDTAYGASEIAIHSKNKIKIAHVPKTIDNDLPLPGNMPTFGYETARHVGFEIVSNIKEDSRSTNRWYIIVAMGRHTGHLALGIGKASAATLTIIPEEFEKDTISISDVCDIIEGSIIKREILGRPDGTVIIAEGIAEKLNIEKLENEQQIIIPRDQYGNVKLSELPLSKILKDEIVKRFNRIKKPMDIVDLTIGYELRSASPIPFDIDYTRTLGHGAVKFLISSNKSNESALICLLNGQVKPLSFEDIKDKNTNKTMVRKVDVNSLYYDVARRYMTRIENNDLRDQKTVNKLAQISKISSSNLIKKYIRNYEK